MRGPKLNPTLFDKLAADTDLPGLGGQTVLTDAGTMATERQQLPYEFADLNRFTEEGLKANVRRDLGWLMNCTNFESSVDLSRFPHVSRSVLNYGVSDLTGKSMSQATILARAAKIKEAVLAFEPRVEPRSVSVTAQSTFERENSVSFAITGDITAAVQALSVRYVTDIEVDTGTVTVRE